MTEVELKMSPIIILLLVLSQTDSVKSFTCKDNAWLCSPDNCGPKNEMDCMETCRVCTDEGCSEGYYHGDGDTCYSCSANEAKHSQNYKEKCNTFCPSKKTHGKYCEKNCSDSCLNRICHKWTGDCERCPSGLSGPRCHQHCNNTDDKGDCIGDCFSGFFRRKCDKECPKQCKDKVCTKTSGNCIGDCLPGSYGPQCDEECPDGCKDKVCNKNTGECLQCIEGFGGKTCQFPSSDNCLNNSCNKNGQCSQGCKFGFFGWNCSGKCSANCLNQKCNRENGSCTDGCVSAKYYGDRCDKYCPHHCLNSTCDRKTGKCKNGCDRTNIYGTFCNYSCGSDCRSVRCESISDYVVCRAVCVRGRKGEHCRDFCPRNCKGSCDQLSGRCLYGCLSGYHGIYCNNSCPANCLGSACHQNNRTCVDGCLTSFYGPTCSNRCSDNCAACNANGICSLSTNDNHDELEVSFDVVWLTLVYGMIALSTLLSISLVVCFILRKRKKISKNKQRRARRRMESLTRARINQIQHVEMQPATWQSSSDTSLDPTDGVRCHSNPPHPSAADGIVISYDENDDDYDSHHYEYIDDCMISSLNSSTGMSSNVPQNEAEECEIENETFYYKRLTSNDANNTDDVVPLLESEQDESVDIKYFHTYVYNMSLMKGFHREFQFLQKINLYSTNVADKLENVSKNRYRDIKPYDYNRVTLELIHGTPASDYINASFIDGYHKSKWYIAAQGPTEKTAADFWRMVWVVNSTHIVMLTNLVDSNQSKCSLYWPNTETKSKKYEDIMVELKQVEVYPTYIFRIFNLSKKSNPELTRTVTQLHYMDWIDKQVPNNVHALLHFIMYVRGLRDRRDDDPLIVHCSDGVGQTGTFIAIDYLLDQALTEGKLNVLGCVSRLRKQRIQMVQTFMQYNFIHQLLLDWLLLFKII